MAGMRKGKVDEKLTGWEKKQVNKWEGENANKVITNFMYMISNKYTYCNWQKEYFGQYSTYCRLCNTCNGNL